MHELPPAYTIAIEDTGGVLNQSFVIDENSSGTTISETRCESPQPSSSSDINNQSRINNDNILHI